MRRAAGLVVGVGLFAWLLACDRPERPAPPAEAPVRSQAPEPPGRGNLAQTDDPGHAPPVDTAARTTAAPASSGWRSIPGDALCVTSGAIAPLGMTRFGIDVPTFRAVIGTRGDTRAELRFTYVGPTKTTRALGSGAVRRQLGLKLRSQDPCNLLYVMWRLEPEAKLVVSIKRNPAAHTSAECGNRGYTNLRPRATGALPPVTPGSSHVLRAEMSGDVLRVLADDAQVWEGEIGAEAMALEGPIGVRSDNVHLEAELLGGGGGAPHPCGHEGDDGE